jgi:ABC-type bacteriocin/lantibiotic exporter with double-glycine peptidase domain
MTAFGGVTPRINEGINTMDPINRKTLFLAFLGGTALWLGAFPSVQTQANPVYSLSEETVQAKVPFIKQDSPRQCGLAAAKMVANYYDQKLSKEQEDLLVNVSEGGKGSKGIMGSELLGTFQAADYDAAVFSGTMDRQETGLYHHLDKHRPLIVMITSVDMTKSHYDVLTGYDPTHQLLLILDPASGPMTLATKDFLHAWRRANCFTLLAIPKKFNVQATPIP